MTHWLGIVKDTLGFLGPVVLVVPWTRDFFARRQRDNIHMLPFEGGMDRLRHKVTGNIDTWLGQAKPSDFIYVVIGLGLLAGSFAISLWEQIASS